jgi:hypothetical protein
MLVIGQVCCLRYFNVKNKGKWDLILMILKLISPIYIFYVFIVNMECVEWGRSLFCIFLTLGVVFMANNQHEVERGVKRD